MIQDLAVSLLAGLQAIVLIGAAFALAHRARVDAKRKRERRMGEEIEGAILHALDTASPIPGEVVHLAPRRLVRDHLLRMASEMAGEERRELTRFLDDHGFTGADIQRLATGSWWGRVESARRLGMARSPRAIPTLTAALTAEHREVRLAALWALGEIGDECATGTFWDAESGVGDISEVRIVDAIARSYRDQPDAMIQRLEHVQSQRSKRLLAQAAGQLFVTGASSAIAQLLRTGDAQARASAAEALGLIGDPEAQELLHQVMADHDARVRAAAATALGRIGDSRSLEALLAWRLDPDLDARLAVETALRSIQAVHGASEPGDEKAAA